MLTAAILREELSYDPASGIFRWLRKGKSRKRVVGGVAGGLWKGYRVIGINGRLYAAHRLAVLYMTGHWPETHVDHRDRDTQNNAWSNLREATRSQNMANMKAHRDNRSGLKGVFKRRDRWVAKVCKDRVSTTIGHFDCPAAAHFAYVVKASELHGEFARAA